MCKYMKDNTLTNILRVLESPDPEDRIILEIYTRKSTKLY